MPDCAVASGDSLAFHPEADAGPKVGIDRGRVVVERFPYSIVYRRDPDFIVIVAVAHQRRRPRYWRSRN